MDIKTQKFRNKGAAPEHMIVRFVPDEDEPRVEFWDPTTPDHQLEGGMSGKMVECLAVSALPPHVGDRVALTGGGTLTAKGYENAMLAISPDVSAFLATRVMDGADETRVAQFLQDLAIDKAEHANMPDRDRASFCDRVAEGYRGSVQDAARIVAGMEMPANRIARILREAFPKGGSMTVEP